MEAIFFNVESGYLEGIVRGFKSGILTTANYINLSQCENLEGDIWHFNLARLQIAVGSHRLWKLSSE